MTFCLKNSTKKQFVEKNVFFQNQHCILGIHLEAVERLHHNEIYPIVLLIKFKSVKQIKEVKDPRCHGEKISQKDAKTIFEHTQKLESEYAHLISGKADLDCLPFALKCRKQFLQHFILYQVNFNDSIHFVSIVLM
jgi:hypothetical protein